MKLDVFTQRALALWALAQIKHDCSSYPKSEKAPNKAEIFRRIEQKVARIVKDYNTP